MQFLKSHNLSIHLQITMLLSFDLVLMVMVVSLPSLPLVLLPNTMVASQFYLLRLSRLLKRVVILWFFFNWTNPFSQPRQCCCIPPAASIWNHLSPPLRTLVPQYPVSQYKPASNSAPTGQATYAISPAGYNSAVSGASSTGNEDLSSSHFKENNVFIAGRQNLQSEGSAIWISPWQRHPYLTGQFFLQCPPHGQPVAFAPAQAVHHARFRGVYPTQSVATGTVHPLLQQSQPTGISPGCRSTAGVYQQPQRISD
ncbi:hypothetical protein HPP92_019780 [Vanilla planifolia]|uniref:Uncharacterized protein n=1 Tax=Vanilla planifolia TaxID=51239 RepID=A0A835Q3X9_VANPL|nr:hypothetical protein HPP92_019780 [Vanilla planifolia]